MLQHNTDGPNCETCLPDHWDVRWQRATSQSANECKGQSDEVMDMKSVYGLILMKLRINPMKQISTIGPLQ